MLNYLLFWNSLLPSPLTLIMSNTEVGVVCGDERTQRLQQMEGKKQDKLILEAYPKFVIVRHLERKPQIALQKTSYICIQFMINSV